MNLLELSHLKMLISITVRGPLFGDSFFYGRSKRRNEGPYGKEKAAV
jgi:hypothetical protein